MNKEIKNKLQHGLALTVKESLDLFKYIEALEQKSILNKIKTEIEQIDFDFGDFYDHTNTIIEMVLTVIDKYKTESEVFVPKNATNGDMIKAMFPNAEIKEIRGSFNKELLGYRTWLGGHSQDYFLDWWDAPYDSESENRE